MVNNAVRNAIEEKLKEMGYELVDVELKKLYGDSVPHFVVYAANLPDGITLDDCEAISNALDPVIEELDVNGGKPYAFDVSSPGLDRPFKTQRDYERNYGKEVEVKLYAPQDGVKEFVGVLLNRNDNVLTIQTDEKTVEIEVGKVAVVRQLIKFS